MKISSQYREIKLFIFSYNGCSNEIDIPKPQDGFYIRQFANGIENVLQKYYNSIVELEKKFLRKPTLSLMFIFHELEKFRPTFEFLVRLINGVDTQKLHGCQILEYLEDNSMHGNENIREALQIVQKSVYTIFIQQLYQWLNGKLHDTHEEFFIIHVDPLNGSDKKPPFSTQTSVNTFQSSEQSINIELWQYDINFDMLPHYFARSWAEKVLFIGRTVLTLNSDTHHSFSSLSTDQEQKIFQKFHQLQHTNKLTVLTFENIIDEIKLSVTELLSDLAIKDADLMKQLRLLKDFYLLGRGELFYEFIKGLHPIFGNAVTENTVRDVNRIFHVSAASVNILDDIELFQFEMHKVDLESFSYESKGLFHFLTLTYKIKSPLHLLFSPRILEKYNELFRFLIHIRKIQYDLQNLWSHHREKKIEKSNELLHFRNKLMFIIDNIMYYLHVDVLESQFTIMMDKIKETRDFEQIIRAHSCFQANVLSLCFQLENVSLKSFCVKLMIILKNYFHSQTDLMTKSITHSVLIMENPVLIILNKIFKLSEQFTAFAYICSSPINEDDRNTFENFEELFASFVDSLLKMLSGNNSAFAITQLLLRLDFNHWFSTKNIKKH